MINEPRCPDSTVAPTPSHLHVLAKQGRHDELEEFLDERGGADIENHNAFHRETALHIAATYGHLKCVDVLLGYGASTQPKDSNGHRPLHRAAMNNHKEVLCLLIEKGARIDVKDKDGNMPMHVAVQNSAYDTAKYLLSMCNINSKNKLSQSPLHLAQESNMISLVLSFGPELNVVDTNRRTPLFQCIENSLYEGVSLLLSHGALLSPKSKLVMHNGLHHATLYSDAEMCKVIIEHFQQFQGTGPGRDRNSSQVLLINQVSRDTAGTCLHIAAAKGNLECVELFLKNNADVNAVNAFGQTPLHVVAQTDRPLTGRIIDRLAEVYGADIEAKDPRRQTPLALAAIHRSLKAISSLIKNGAGVTGELAVILAKRSATLKQTAPFRAAAPKEKISSFSELLFENKSSSGDDLADLYLIIGEERREYRVHRCVLVARSTHFKAMLTGNMNEAYCDKIELRNVDPDTFERLLQYLYVGVLSKHADINELLHLLILADEWIMEDLKQRCVVVLKGYINDDNVSDILQIATKYAVESLRVFCVSYISGHGRARSLIHSLQQHLIDSPDCDCYVKGDKELHSDMKCLFRDGVLTDVKFICPKKSNLVERAQNNEKDEILALSIDSDGEIDWENDGQSQSESVCAHKVVLRSRSIILFDLMEKSLSDEKVEHGDGSHETKEAGSGGLGSCVPGSRSGSGFEFGLGYGLDEDLDHTVVRINVSRRALEILLEFMYTGTIFSKPSRGRNVESVLEVALCGRKYLNSKYLPSLLSECAIYISNHLKVSNVLSVFPVVKKLKKHLADLYAECVRFLLNNFSEVMTENNFDDQSAAQKKLLLECFGFFDTDRKLDSYSGPTSPSPLASDSVQFPKSSSSNSNFSVTTSSYTEDDLDSESDFEDELGLYRVADDAEILGYAAEPANLSKKKRKNRTSKKVEEPKQDNSVAAQQFVHEASKLNPKAETFVSKTSPAPPPASHHHSQNQHKHRQQQHQRQHRQYQSQHRQQQHQRQHRQYQSQHRQPQHRQYHPQHRQYHPQHRQHQPQHRQHQPHNRQHEPHNRQHQPQHRKYQPQHRKYQPQHHERQRQHRQREHQHRQQDTGTKGDDVSEFGARVGSVSDSRAELNAKNVWDSTKAKKWKKKTDVGCL